MFFEDRLYFMAKGKVVCSDTKHNLDWKEDGTSE
jgi:hypothetical protein